jgi:hypothetical protein
MRTLNWPEPYEACREGAVNRRLAPSFTVLVAKCPADWALRTQKTTLPATISMKRRCRGHRATVTRERPSSGSGSSVMCVLGSPLWNVKLLPERSSSSGTLSTCSNVDQIHCGRDGVLSTIWRPTSAAAQPVSLARRPPVTAGSLVPRRIFGIIMAQPTIEALCRMRLVGRPDNGASEVVTLLDYRNP